MRLEEFLTEDQLDELNLAKALGSFTQKTVDAAKQAKKAAVRKAAGAKASFKAGRVAAQDQAGKAAMAKTINKPAATASENPKANAFAEIQQMIAKLTPDQKYELQLELERVKV